MIEIKNFAKTGATSELVLSEQLPAAESFHPSLAVLLVGTCDCTKPNSLRGPEKFRSSIRAIFEKLNRMGTRILALTIPPVIEFDLMQKNNPATYGDFGPSDRIAAANRVLREEADHAGATLADLHADFAKGDLEAVYGPLCSRNNYFGEYDGCHPTRDGKLQIVEFVEKAIRSMCADTSRIAFFGDAITAEEEQAEFERYPFMLQKLLCPNPVPAKASVPGLDIAVIYQLFLRAFTKEGTIAAAETHLDEIAATGANIVYLVPFVEADDDMDEQFWSSRQKASKCNNARSPYRLMDFYKIDPEYGTAEDFRNFATACHARGLKVMVDLVYYHAGPTFAKLHPTFVRRNPDGTLLNGAWCFPRLDFANPELREYLIQNMEYFIREFDVDGFRCDVGGQVGLDFWCEGRRRCEALKSGLIMLCESETERPEDQYEAFDINYGFSFACGLCEMLRGEHSALDLIRQERIRAACGLRGARFLRSIENHDIVNDQYDRRNGIVAGPLAEEAALAYCFLLDGVPFLYNGVEWRDSSRHSIFANPGQYTIDRSSGVPKRTAFLKRLTDLRRSEPALLYGTIEFTEENASRGAIVFKRTYEDTEIEILVNLTPKMIAFENRAAGEVLLEYGLTQCKNNFRLEGWGFLVIRRRLSGE